MGSSPTRPTSDRATHKAGDLAAAAAVKLNIKGLRHYADPVSEVDRRAAACIVQLTAGSTS